MRAMTGVWRWRRNPLRRRTDLAESWVALLAAVLILLGAPAVGVMVGSLVQDTLVQSVREQHQQRHLVTASAVRTLRQPTVDPDPETSSSRDAGGPRVVATWKAPDGKTRTGTATAPRLLTPGDRFRIWTDDQGRLVASPMSVSRAGRHAALAGAGAAAVAAGLVELMHRTVLWRLLRRRYDKWDHAWERASQDWGRTGTGS
jgi:hypothetical protein